jgi:hypothetical protein
MQAMKYIMPFSKTHQWKIIEEMYLIDVFGEHPRMMSL